MCHASPFSTVRGPLLRHHHKVAIITSNDSPKGSIFAYST